MEGKTAPFSALFLLAFFFGPALCGKFRIESPPKGWTRLEAVHKDTDVSFTFMLQRRNLAGLKELYENVTDPLRPQWRQFWTPEQVAEFTRPHPDVFLEFEDWIGSFRGGLTVQKGIYSISVSTTAGIASALFRAPFFVYQHSSAFRAVRIGGTAHIPASLESKIESISGLTDLALIQKYGRRSSPDSSKGRQTSSGPTVTPNVLAQAYGINYTASPVHPRSLQAIIALNDSFSVNALNMFRSDYGLKPITVNYVGTNCLPFCGQGESDLDIQYITSTGDGIPTMFIQSPEATVNGMLSAFNYIDSLSYNYLPLVVSLSYGSDENFFFDGNIYSSVAYSLETVFISLGAKGVSILVSAGDAGVGGNNYFSYTGNGCELAPSFPATSPYVTAVGATQLVGVNLPYTEIVAQVSSGSVISSGGGFSWVHSTPSWQTGAIAGWGFDPNIISTNYPTNHRGIPDISLVGHQYAVYVDNQDGTVNTQGLYDGTSASSPAFAGMISLINNKLLNAGSYPIGPLNHLLYQLYSSSPNIFNRVTSGSNPCLPSRCLCCSTGSINSMGFTDSVTTWNPTVGLGTPKFLGLMEGIKTAASHASHVTLTGWVLFWFLAIVLQ